MMTAGKARMLPVLVTWADRRSAVVFPFDVPGLQGRLAGSLRDGAVFAGLFRATRREFLVGLG
jgi:hypothetical protein